MSGFLDPDRLLVLDNGFLPRKITIGHTEAGPTLTVTFTGVNCYEVAEALARFRNLDLREIVSKLPDNSSIAEFHKQHHSSIITSNDIK